MKNVPFQQQLEDAAEINKFMGSMAFNYTLDTYQGLWKSMEKFCKRFGRHFVAEMIRKDSGNVSIELYLDYKGYKRKRLAVCS